MTSKRLQEKFDYHSNNRESDMWYHFDYLRALSSDCNIIMELGTRSVVSTWAFLHGMSGSAERMVFMDESRRKLYLGSAKTLWSFDIFHPKEHGVNTDEVFDIAEENNIKWELKIEDSLKTEVPICDLIFFDTDHNYNQLSQELKLHGNKSRKYLVFHDTMKYGMELVPAINEFLEENEEWTILSCENACQGLTSLVKAPVEKVRAWVDQ